MRIYNDSTLLRSIVVIESILCIYLYGYYTSVNMIFAAVFSAFGGLALLSLWVKFLLQSIDLGYTLYRERKNEHWIIPTGGFTLFYFINGNQFKFINGNQFKGNQKYSV